MYPPKKEKRQINQKQPKDIDITMCFDDLSSLSHPETWRKTPWRRIQKKIFPTSYRKSLRHNTQMWEQYIKHVEDGTVLPMPK